MNTTDDFASEFLYIDFDNILSQNNSPFLNSDQMYIKYKEEYLSQTMKNYASYKELQSTLFSFLPPVSDTPSKILYTFTDNNQIELVRSQIKSLFILQRTLYTNFLDHVTKLASISPPENAKRKTLLQKIGIMPSDNLKRR
jgi:hypothetical protein